MKSTISTAMFVIFVLTCVVEAQERIVFTSSRGDGRSEIYVMDADGRESSKPHELGIILRFLKEVGNSELSGEIAKHH